MNIIQYIPYSYHIHLGGLEKIAQTLSNGFNSQKNTKCINISSDIRRGKESELNEHDDTIFIPSFDIINNFPIPKFGSKSFRKHFSLIKQASPDIIITHTRFFIQSMIGGLIAKRLGCKRIHIEHGSGFVTGYPRYIKICARAFDWTIGLRIFRQCDQIITISEMHKKFIKKFTNKTPVVIYNPIDYTPQEKVKNNIPHIGFIGRLVPLKGVDLLIQALKQIESKEWTCTIVGTGSEDETLKNLTQTLGLSDRIVFVGADDRTNRLHKFDIFVNPSHQEGLPTTVVEALIAGCIVVATDVGGTKEISNEDDLIIIKNTTAKKIKEGILLALKHQDQSHKSHQQVVQKFGSKEIIIQYLTTLTHHGSIGKQ